MIEKVKNVCAGVVGIVLIMGVAVKLAWPNKRIYS